MSAVNLQQDLNKCKLWRIGPGFQQGVVGWGVGGRSWFVLQYVRFMFCDRYETHIQTLGFVTAKLMSEDSSSSTFHDFKILSSISINISRTPKIRNPKGGFIHVPTFSNFLILIFPWKRCSYISPGCSLCFLEFVQIFWSNKIKKYGVQDKSSSNLELSMSNIILNIMKSGFS